MKDTAILTRWLDMCCVSGSGRDVHIASVQQESLPSSLPTSDAINSVEGKVDDAGARSGGVEG